MASNICTFCQIVQGAQDALIVHEDAGCVAFLDRRPVFPGHVLLVPRVHHQTMTDLPPELVGPVFETARLLARAVETGMQADGSFVAVNNRVSQSVPHLHVHVVPRRKGDGLRGFFWPRHPYLDDDHARETQARLRQAVERLVRG